jgi:hypothetical protein
VCVWLVARNMDRQHSKHKHRAIQTGTLNRTDWSVHAEQGGLNAPHAQVWMQGRGRKGEGGRYLVQLRLPAEVATGSLPETESPPRHQWSAPRPCVPHSTHQHDRCLSHSSTLRKSPHVHLPNPNSSCRRERMHPQIQYCSAPMSHPRRLDALSAVGAADIGVRSGRCKGQCKHWLV